jgi:hypothetical protein
VRCVSLTIVGVGIAYSECVSVGLVILHAKRTRRFFVYGVCGIFPHIIS